MTSPPAISFLVCTRNRAEVARECVLHLLGSPRDDIEVVVRDNCSTDNSTELLRAIDDVRLKIHVAPENQGTRSFFEISKLARGKIVTWLSDEDNFQFEHLDFILTMFDANPDCNSVFGSIFVGAAARRVMFADETVTDPVRACITALSFSGCGGLFVRSSTLAAANCLNVRDANDAYALWNYYPVGFFASRCIDRTLITTSRVVVIQSRFARTTNNWSKTGPQASERLAHYYPESVFDRLSSNLVNLYLKQLPLLVRLSGARQLIRTFRLQTASYSNHALHDLLRENYNSETVDGYLRHINSLRLDHSVGRFLWTQRNLLSLPLRFFQTLNRWRKLAASQPQKSL